MYWLILNIVSAQEILVGVDEAPPFSIKTESGWDGIAIDLWEDIAKENNWKYKYVESNFQDSLELVETKKIDVALPGITVTKEREKLMDFSHSYMIEDIVIATKNMSWFSFIKNISLKLLNPIFYLLSILSFAGFIFFILEKRKLGLRGFFDSIYWALTTMTTVGYGDESAKNTIGRAFSMLWMFIALFIFASLNAQVLKAFSETTWVPDLSEISDLKNNNVVTVKGSFSEELLNINEIYATMYNSEKELVSSISKINDNKIFIVYDRSILEYNLPQDFIILDKGYYEQHLAFAIQTNSSYKEKINQGILDRIGTNWWKEVTFKYKRKR